MPEMKVLTCPGPPEHEFEIPKGRGRPPRYCEDHKPNGNKPEEKMSEEKTRKAPPKSSGESKPATRKAPPVKKPDDSGSNGKSDETPRDENIRRLPPPGRGDLGSRAKAENAADHTVRQQPDSDQSWPRGKQGRPMAKIEFSASELIPTGQYANVSVGPGRVTTFIDLDRVVEDGESFFTESERQNLIQATNELAELVERDVIAVQRSLVLESLQDQKNDN
jgi:hypothetical protein